MTMFGLDYAGGRPNPAAIRAAGFGFVVRYLTPGGPSLPGKLLLPAEAAAHRAAGVDIVSNVELYANRMAEGFNAGVADAQAGWAQHKACGGPDNRPIYFSADWDVQTAQLPGVFAYLDGAAAVIGRAHVGIYGGYTAVSQAVTTGHATWAWQTDAWSRGVVFGGRHIHQRIQQTTVDGVACDVNEALTEDFGQWSYQEDDMFNDTDRAWLEDTMRRLQQLVLNGGKPLDLSQPVPPWQAGANLTELGSWAYETQRPHAEWVAGFIAARVAALDAVLAHALAAQPGVTLTADELTQAAQAGAQAALVELGKTLSPATPAPAPAPAPVPPVAS